MTCRRSPVSFWPLPDAAVSSLPWAAALNETRRGPPVGSGRAHARRSTLRLFPSPAPCSTTHFLGEEETPDRSPAPLDEDVRWPSSVVKHNAPRPRLMPSHGVVPCGAGVPRGAAPGDAPIPEGLRLTGGRPAGGDPAAAKPHRTRFNRLRALPGTAPRNRRPSLAQRGRCGAAGTR